MFSEKRADISNQSWHFFFPWLGLRLFLNMAFQRAPKNQLELASLWGGTILSLFYIGLLWHHSLVPSLAPTPSAYKNTSFFTWWSTSLLLHYSSTQFIGSQGHQLHPWIQGHTHSQMVHSIPRATAVGSGLYKRELGILLLATKRIRLKQHPSWCIPPTLQFYGSLVKIPTRPTTLSTLTCPAQGNIQSCHHFSGTGVSSS